MILLDQVLDLKARLSNNNNALSLKGCNVSFSALWTNNKRIQDTF